MWRSITDFFTSTVHIIPHPHYNRNIILYFRVLLENSSADSDTKKVVVVSISPQSLASLAAKFSLTMETCLAKLTTFLKDIGCDNVYNTNIARNFCLLEMVDEFIDR